MRTCLAVLILLANLTIASGLQAKWVSIGPYGGDARALAADPRDPDRMYAGTRTGQVYLTENAGRSWAPLDGLRLPSYWVVDQLHVDPNNHEVVYAAAWSLRNKDGGVWKSQDRGRTWSALEGIQGQSVRALTLAPSDPRTLVAGTLQGVFRSRDAGASWQRISPLNHEEIHSVESVAVDPRDSDTIYAGTWHLAWKTTDGGQRWFPIKKGMLDDSDVFSIVIDPQNPDRVYATACSGIYRSDSAGAQWRRIQGIPASSRRTHTLVIDPGDTNIVYAGTTEGLWRTGDRGATWKLLTERTWSINAIVLDQREPGGFFLALDHAGVVQSIGQSVGQSAGQGDSEILEMPPAAARDGRARFRETNWGFAQRQISQVVIDPAAPPAAPVLYAGTLHDGSLGGVFTSSNLGTSWQKLSEGLKGLDVLSLLIITQPTWKLLAGTPNGVFEYTPNQPVWQNRGKWLLPSVPAEPTLKSGTPAGGKASGKPLAKQKARPAPPPIAVRNLYQRSPDEPILAATSQGLFESVDGVTWRPLLLDGASGGHYAIASTGLGTGLGSGAESHHLVAASARSLILSRDQGRTWSEVQFDDAQLGDGQPVRIHKLAASPGDARRVLAASHAGLLRSNDGGVSWTRNGRGLPAGAVTDISFDPASSHQLWLAGAAGLFHSLDGGEWYSRLDPAFSTDDDSRLDLKSLFFPSNMPALAVTVNNGLFVQDDIRHSFPSIAGPAR